MNTALLYLFMATSQTFNLPPGVLSSVCYVESKHKIGVIHELDGKTSSIGICQIKLATARGEGFSGTEDDLLNPGVNIYFAGKFLAHQMHRCGSTYAGVRAYNTGSCGGIRGQYVHRVKLAMLEAL